MWSAPEDRAQAERRARMTKKRTPAQEKRRAQRETAFNAGYDLAALMFAERLGIEPSQTRRYLEQRTTAYGAWEYAEDRD